MFSKLGLDEVYFFFFLPFKPYVNLVFLSKSVKKQRHLNKAKMLFLFLNFV